MKITVNEEKNRVYINKEEYAIITKYDDPDFGHVFKCCTLELKKYRRLYVIEKDNSYNLVTDENIFKKLVEKYEQPISDTIID